MERIHEFRWETTYFNGVDKKTQDFARELLKQDAIKDVYMLEGKQQVFIETDFDCQNSLWKLQEHSEEPIVPLEKYKTFPVPYTIKATMKLNCNKAKALKCNYTACPIIVAGFYYQEQRMNQKMEEEKKQLELEKARKRKEKQRAEIDKFLTDEIREQHQEILQELFQENELTTPVKIELVKLIKTLVNFQAIRETAGILRPYTNYAFMENTDTVSNLCLGQQKCIQYVMKIMKYFHFIEQENYKLVNLKELTENDILMDENYKEEVIVLTNLYALYNSMPNEKDFRKFIKNNLPSFILNQSNDKIFILCDKTANVRALYQRYPQLKFLFESIQIPDLTEEEIHQILMSKILQNQHLDLEYKFDEKLKEYLHKEYMFSAYQNLEFVDYVYKEILRKMLLTNHPNLLTIQEFPLFRVDDELDFESFNQLVGLDNIKAEVKDLYEYLDLQRSKKARGDKMPDVELHMVYLGNPGTGKTTVARFMGGILFNLGFIRYNKCIECESKDLISDVAGQTAIKTSEKIQEAMGGILFIDEAYAIGENVYGAECIATLIKAMEDFRNDLVVILAGYKVEMERFLEINSGFKSRVPYTFEFKDYTIQELIKLTLQLFSKYNLQIQGSMVTERLEEIYSAAKRADAGFGNGRYVRTTVDKILKQHAINTANVEDEFKRNNLITISDLNFTHKW